MVVQAFPSLHGVPLTLFVTAEHTPVAGLHAPPLWHASPLGQTTGLLPTQKPAWQASLSVHALASLHELPSAFAGFEQLPVAGSHVPAS